MSVSVMTWVWNSSTSGPTQRLVLLAIADCANDQGTDAYPATATLAKKTGLSERGVRKAINGLRSIGELAVEYKAGPRGCNRYRVLMSDPVPHAGNPEPDATRHDVHSAPRATSTRHDVPGTRHKTSPDPAPGAPEPSMNKPEPKNIMSATEPPTSKTPRPDVEHICRHLADRIEANGSKRPTITDGWRTAARLLLDADHRTVVQVVAAIDWCQSDDFWRGNVLSMSKLRTRYDQLRLAAQRANGQRGQRDYNGLMLNEQTIADLERGRRLAAMDKLAIEEKS
jgi:hypothetical protein